MKLNEIKESRETAIRKTLSNYGIWVTRPEGVSEKRRSNTVKEIVINDDETVSIDGSVSFEHASFKKLPVKFKDIHELNCGECEKLETLLGFPETVRKSIILQGCLNLRTLEHGPKFVNEHVNLERCVRLESLDHFPKMGTSERGTSVNISSCRALRSLKGLPKILTSFLVMEWYQGTTLEGMPEELGKSLYLSNGRMHSLDYLPKRMPGEDATIHLSHLKFAKNFLAVFKVRELTRVTIDDIKPLERIMNKHLKSSNRDVMDCQEEMIESGYSEYAKLK